MVVLVDAAVTLDRWRVTGQPTLNSDGVTLRPWEAGDVDAVVRAYADPTIQRWHVQVQSPVEAARWISSWPARWDAGTGADWAVTDEAGDVAGRIGFRQIDLFEGEAEVAYWVLPEARGRRIAPRALTALTRWAFEDAGLLRIALRHSVDNQPSCRVAEQAGFAYEGTMIRAGRHADGPHDMHLHALVVPPPTPR